MFGNPIEEWQRLTAHYREMSDVALCELAADMADLTEVAQGVLRDEMRSRHLDAPRAEAAAPLSRDAPEDWTTQEVQTDSDSAGLEEVVPHEYTWKTPLAECETREEAWQLAETLRRAGVESWIEAPRSRFSNDLRNPRVMVAADQLDEARRIAEGTIPQEIVEESKAEPPEFKLPKCPACGAEDPVLEGVDPANVWLCEACGKQWTDPVVAETEK
jgi:hypothetical protein